MQHASVPRMADFGDCPTPGESSDPSAWVNWILCLIQAGVSVGVAVSMAEDQAADLGTDTAEQSYLQAIANLQAELDRLRAEEDRILGFKPAELALLVGGIVLLMRQRR